MSIRGTFDAPPEAAVPVLLATTGVTDIYTAGSGDNSSVLCGLVLPNNSANAVQVKAWYNDGTTDHLIFTRQVPANDTVIVEGIAYRLRGGTKIKAQAASGNAITVTALIARTHRNVAT